MLLRKHLFILGKFSHFSAKWIKESDVRSHNQDTCLIRRTSPGSWYLSGERQRKYSGTKVKQKILQHFHFQFLSLSLSFEASAQPKMAFLLNKTSIASHFRPHSQNTVDALSHSRRAYHIELGAREKAVSLSLFSLLLYHCISLQ
ncbi:hypothetical protein RGQ29_004070 [Quercus rubra]|uniref:Uncharacterized protein n=1 Tax=Quercus rubra TaxID=3512 RepID=A0AAN7EDS1_QUERU|nr:hypothetical protein RGQ29_004070 [Quercus rubra]